MKWKLVILCVITKHPRHLIKTISKTNLKPTFGILGKKFKSMDNDFIIVK